MRNKEYWAARALQRENEAYLRGAGLSAKMFQEYETAAKAIRREIDGFYSKYAGKYGLTYDQAVRLLNRKEFQEWKASLDAYVAQIAQTTDAHARALLTAQLDALSANSSISRLEALQGQIDLILNDLFDKGVAQMKEEFGDMYNRHGQIADEVNKRLGSDQVEEKTLAVGMEVDFTGTSHYTSAYKTATRKTCKAGKSKITAIAAGKAHPYHLVAVSGRGSTVYGWVDAADISAGADQTIRKGDKVKVLKAQTYNGGTFKTYYDVYDVIQVNGDRVVIGIGKTVTAAVKASNLQKV